MGHDHHHAPRDFGRAFLIGILLNTVYVVVEAGVGLAIGSMGLVADAGHNASDVLSLVVAWIAARMARRAPSPRFTYGWRRGTILASLFNAQLLFVAMGMVAWEAIERLREPVAVPGGVIVAVTAVGLVVNFGTAFLFTGGRGDLNIRGAYLHMLADGLVTLGVLAAGLAIRFTGLAWLDPAIALVIVAIVLWSTWDLFTGGLRLALDAVPEGIDVDAVHAALAGIPGVVDVHDLHVWPMSTTEAALTAHLVVDDHGQGNHDVLERARDRLADDFHLHHVTIQLECRAAARHGAEGSCSPVLAGEPAPG